MSKISRRRFVEGTGAGVIAVSAVPLEAQQKKSAANEPGGAQALAAPRTKIALTINGTKHSVEVEDRWTLNELLREHLELTGTKLGCDRAECGACTVLIDDVPHYSCSVLTHTVRDRKVQTIEGLAVEGALHPVQQAVVDEQGFQCAFCMPGFVMAAVGYLKTQPSPTRAELAHGVSGNLCRCQDYDKILTALMKGAEHMRNA